MTSTSCLHCGAETSNGLVLCERCQIAASVIFEFLPVYFRNLARWRPGRAGSRPVPGSREPANIGSGTAGDRIGAVLDEVGGDISTWARSLADDRPVTLPEQEDEAATVVALCRLFAENLTSIATLEWCGEFLRQMSEHETRLRKLTERVAPGWYAGACKHCNQPTFVIPGLTWVKCDSCGVTTYARDHIETIRTEAREWIAPPKRLAEAAVALIDTEQSVPRLYERIKKWGQRDRIDTVRKLDSDGDPVGAKRYRFGQVLDALLIEGETRIVPDVNAKAS